MNEFVRGFRPQRGICRHHRKDVEVDIEIKRGWFRPPVPTRSMTGVPGDNSINARDYIWALCKWLGASRKDPDRLDPNGCIEPDSGEVRTTGRLKSAPFQQHGGRSRERVWGLSDRGMVGVSAGSSKAALGSRGAASSLEYHNPPICLETAPPSTLINLGLVEGHVNYGHANGHPDALTAGEIYDSDQTSAKDKERKSLESRAGWRGFRGAGFGQEPLREY